MLSSRQIGVFKAACKGVVDDVIMCQRLLDQKQFEFVESLERVQIVQGIRGIRIDLQWELGISLTHPADDLDIPARRDF